VSVKARWGQRGESYKVGVDRKKHRFGTADHKYDLGYGKENSSKEATKSGTKTSDSRVSHTNEHRPRIPSGEAKRGCGNSGLGRDEAVTLK